MPKTCGAAYGVCLTSQDLLAQLKSDPFTWRDADAYAQDIEQTYTAVLAQRGPTPQVSDKPRPSAQASATSQPSMRCLASFGIRRLTWYRHA